MPKICIDPGHGGRDSGAVGPSTYEKNNVLQLAQKIAAILQASGIETVLTHSDDRDFCPGYFNVDEDLQNRVAVANSSGADIFISLHNNSGGGNGNEVYALQPGGPGGKLAQCIHARMLGLSMADRGVKFAGWYVVRKTTMPAVLVEYGFIDTEESLILAKMDQAALTIAQGIGDYLGIEVKGEDDVLKDAIVMFSDEDYWAAKDVNAKHGNSLAIFNRDRKTEAPQDAMKAEHIFTIGGPPTGHKNETLLSGQNKYETAAKVGQYLAQN